jgi:predicted transcriptional regulator
MIKELTKAEEQIMQILWKKEKGFVKDLVDEFENPKPAINTVSTIIRILEKKGFVGYTAYGKTHEYYPLISKKEYSKHYFKNFLTNYFGNSYQKMVSFFADENEMTIEEMEEIKRTLDENINSKSDNNE